MAQDGERQALSHYLREIRGIPLLSREEESGLLQRIDRGDPDARSSLIESNLGFTETGF